LLRWALIGAAAIVVVGLAVAVPMVWWLLTKRARALTMVQPLYT